MKKTVDAHRRDASFAIDDWVYVKLRPYRHTSLLGTNYEKLSKRYYGPYQIIETVNPITYKFVVPNFTKIHSDSIVPY